MAMRTTTHHGRGNGGKAYSSKHNDRNFDVEKASHIDAEKSSENQYWCVYGEMTFEAAELKFYEDHFGTQLQAINDGYIKNRHPERCKTMAQWKALRQNAPEESIYQIGNREAHADAETLIDCYNEFIEFQSEWNIKHGNPFSVLNTALHMDEPGCPPHIHSRQVWYYRDKDGTLRIGQEKALKAAGIPLPNPDKKESRYNNRKMTYDKMMRDKWLSICESHGLQVERVPVPGRKRSKPLEDYIREKNERLTKEVEALRASLAVLDESGELDGIEATQSLTGAKTTLKTDDYDRLMECAKKGAAAAQEYKRAAARADSLQKLYDDERVKRVTAESELHEYRIGTKERPEAERIREEHSAMKEFLRSFNLIERFQAWFKGWKERRQQRKIERSTDDLEKSENS